MRLLSAPYLTSRLALALVVSTGLAACAPTLDPAVKADFDRRLSQLPTNEETYPPSEAYLPLAFAVGQWTQHRVRDTKGAQLITNRLVGRDSGGYWMESEIESYEGKEWVKMHVALLGGRDASGAEIRELSVRKNDSAMIVDFRGDELAAGRAQYGYLIDLLAIVFESDIKDDVRVPGGHFIGCYKFETGRPWGPWQKGSLVCAHPSVPLSGVVQALPLDASGSLELVGFGVAPAEEAAQ